MRVRVGVRVRASVRIRVRVLVRVRVRARARARAGAKAGARAVRVTNLHGISLEDPTGHDMPLLHSVQSEAPFAFLAPP